MTDVSSRYALLIFCLCAGAEFLVARFRGHEYRINNMLSNLGIAMLALIAGYFSIVVNVYVYAWVYDHWRLIDFPQPWVWPFALVAYDFCYYWLHRLSHEINFLWAIHAVHHSSEDLNVTTTIRVNPLGLLFNWPFYIPLALCGVPASIYLTIGSINLIYSFWVHTTEIGSLGWFDRVFGSPSNHRVHHGQNDYCIDRNYGCILMIWDRLFKSFRDEKPDEPVVFGMRGGLSRWNPMDAITRVFGELAMRTRQAPNWREGVAVWFRSPEWLSTGNMSVAGSPNAIEFTKFDVRPDRPLQHQLVFQFLLIVFMAAYVLMHPKDFQMSSAIMPALLIVAKIWIMGAFLDRDPNATRVEVAWWAAAVAVASARGLDQGLAVAACGVVSLFGLISALSRSAERAEERRS